MGNKFRNSFAFFIRIRIDEGYDLSPIVITPIIININLYRLTNNYIFANLIQYCLTARFTF